MQKIETIWHDLLWQALEKGEFRHTQKSLAERFDYSLSTVNLAIKELKNVGIVEVGGKFFILKEVKKLLFYWATHRKLFKDIIYQTFVDEPINEIEGLAPPQAIFAGYTAARRILGEPPADYSRVYFYFDENKLEAVKKRFPPDKSNPNLFVLKNYPQQAEYGQISTLPQTFVDIWNLGDWYAKDFLNELEKRIGSLIPGYFK